MRKSILTSVVLLISYSVFSQTTNPYKNKPWEDLKKREALKDTLRKAFGDRSLSIPNPGSADKPGNNMPIVRFPTKGKYMGNNGKGSDIYAMQPDNMPCLVPDSSFASNMPLAGKMQSLNYNNSESEKKKALMEELLRKKKENSQTE